MKQLSRIFAALAFVIALVSACQVGPSSPSSLGDAGADAGAPPDPGRKFGFAPPPTGTGIPHVFAGQYNVAASNIVNADVDSAAAISGSKINPTFSATISTTAGLSVANSESLGTSVGTVASTGILRLPNGTSGSIISRGGTAVDVTEMYVDGSNNVQVGDPTNANGVVVSAAGNIIELASAQGVFEWGGFATPSVLQSKFASLEPSGAGLVFGDWWIDTQGRLACLDAFGNRMTGAFTGALANDFTTTSTVSLQSTNLTCQLAVLGVNGAAADSLVVDFGGTTISAANTNGVQFGISIPTGATIEGGVHSAGPISLANFLEARINAGSTATAAFNTFSGAAAPFWGSVRVKGDGAHSGPVTIQLQPGTTAAVTMKAGSWIRCTTAILL